MSSKWSVEKMKLTNPEKLTLVMLSEIYEKLGINGGDNIDPNFIKEAIYSDNTWGLDWKYSGIFYDKTDPNPPEVTEVVDILDMWSFIEESYEQLSADEKNELVAKADPFGKHVKFSGFDGNNETKHLSIADFLINELDRFSRFEGRDLNSHAPSLATYDRMYKVFEPIRNTLVGHGLDVDELAAILNAQRYS
ncbi:TPA: YfbU family protein [Yersinia enterocolitica]|nr:YfbU family protein [Yersinia enterocolitica]HDL7771844.1 YfbU family protein [Yersinia enterocolitica]HDL7779640.1 YfbU family protein [Yersinia enterocolitica]HDL7794149.1 YfbU family protein [Yersinia enterocolitica]HDL7815103.1 YfbU family protein [Yersinia enterocolitica]